MAPDYDHLTLMQKVEVFEHALSNTNGDDLAKLLWLKSPSSEVLKSSLFVKPENMKYVVELFFACLIMTNLFYRFSSTKNGKLKKPELFLKHIKYCICIFSPRKVWFDRRTNYTRSLAVMSMVGYVLGLGDR